MFEECKAISNLLKKEGYFTNTIDSIPNTDNNYTCYFSLKKKIKKIVLLNTSNKDSVFLNPKDVNLYLEKITSKFDGKGQSFTKSALKVFKIKKNILYAHLTSYPSKERKIDKIIIKGYKSFPTKFIKNHFYIKKQETVFSRNKLKKISKSIKTLSFIEEIKPSETLFKKDSTILYLYLKKLQNNSFNGLVNFTTKEDGSVVFNGLANIKLNNLFDKGESFYLNWNAIGDDRQELEINLKTPYIFNSKLTPKFLFNIYRQDSTFINTKFSGLINYPINNKINIGLSFLSESSETLTEVTQNTNTSYNSFFSGINFNYIVPNENKFLKNKFSLSIQPLFGNRRTKEFSNTQLKVNATLSYLLKINTTNFLYLKNSTGILNSPNLINNELYRIGGAKTIRGFNEQSFFTPNFTYFNIEYRYLTSKTAYFYSISDLGRLEISSKKNDVIGLGFGYAFFSKNSKINISTALGNNLKSSFVIQDPKLIISWKIFF